MSLLPGATISSGYEMPGPITGVETRGTVEKRFDLSKEYADSTYGMVIEQLPNLIDASIVNTAIDLIKAGLGDLVMRTVINPLSGHYEPPPDMPVKPMMKEFHVDLTNIPDPVYRDTTGTYSSALSTATVNKILDWVLNNVTGLDPEVQAAELELLNARQTIENERRYAQVAATSEALGWCLPQAGYMSMMTEVNSEISRNNTTNNLSVWVKNAELIQSNKHFAITSSIEIEKGFMNYILESGRNGVELYKADIMKFAEVLRGRLTEAQVIATENESLAKMYEAEAKGFSTIVDAIIRSFESDTKMAIAESELLLKKKQVELDNATQIYGIYRDAIKSYAMIASQLCASAMGSVSASAALHYNESRQDSTSKSQSNQWSGEERVSINHNWNHSS